MGSRTPKLTFDPKTIGEFIEALRAAEALPGPESKEEVRRLCSRNEYKLQFSLLFERKSPLGLELRSAILDWYLARLKWIFFSDNCSEVEQLPLHEALAGAIALDEVFHWAVETPRIDTAEGLLDLLSRFRVSPLFRGLGEQAKWIIRGSKNARHDFSNKHYLSNIANDLYTIYLTYEWAAKLISGTDRYIDWCEQQGKPWLESKNLSHIVNNVDMTLHQPYARRLTLDELFDVFAATEEPVAFEGNALRMPVLGHPPPFPSYALMCPEGPKAEDNCSHLAPQGTSKQLITLNQAAATVCRTKQALEKYKKKGLPEPDVQGGGGKPDYYDWDVMRPWLAETFGFDLPERYPGS